MRHWAERVNARTVRGTTRVARGTIRGMVRRARRAREGCMVMRWSDVFYAR